jgi:hypothetical protein
VLWRTFGGKGEGDPEAGDPEAVKRAHSRAEDRIGQLEVRLHDFAREVEARMETRALQLDSLVVAGDREIVRLSTILNQLHLNEGSSSRQPDVMHFESNPLTSTGAAAATRSAQAGAATVPAPQAEMAGHLNEAGYSVSEIAHIIGQPAEVIKSLLKKAA